MEPRWYEGIWLGKLWRSDEHVLFSNGRVVRAKCIRGLPEVNSWSLAEVEKINVTPWNLQGQVEGPAEVIRIQHDPEATLPVDPSGRAVPRGARVERRDL